MATQRTIPDTDFGQIIIRSHRSARNITLRTKPDGLYVTVPPRCYLSRILEVIGQHRARLLEKWQKISPQPFDLNFHIDAPCFRLQVEQGGWKCFTVRSTEEETIIYCPKDVDFTLKTTQDLLKNAVIRALKKRAASYLPLLLKELSERYELPFKRVKITGSRSRWGSCSAVKSINLSCYLMLLPPHLMDYVLLHELAHTKEMNHGPRFWELLNDMTEGKAHNLRNELKNYKTFF